MAKPTRKPKAKPKLKARSAGAKSKAKVKARKVAAPRVKPKRARAALLPSYDALPVRAGAPDGSAWGVFGDEDECGTVNLLTPERVTAAAAEIKTGRVFALNLPINIPDPPLFTRGAHKHVIKTFPGAEFVLDDYLDNFYPQASSQWDALCHVKHPTLGAYNGIPNHEITGHGGTKLGIDNLARRGLAGRGVLADVGRYYERHRKVIDYTKAQPIPLDDIKATLAEQKTKPQTGDVLLLRFGWTRFYLSASAETKAELARETACPGIEASATVAAWIWNHHFAAIASDAPALEALPAPGQDFLHFHLLSFFGMPIGEMWNLEGLADDCAADGRYEFFFTSAPLNIPGGVGSPPNALAIR